jgi:hypothetical protein
MSPGRCMCMGGSAPCVPPFGLSGGCSVSDDEHATHQWAYEVDGCGVCLTARIPGSIVEAAAHAARQWAPDRKVISIRIARPDEETE